MRALWIGLAVALLATGVGGCKVKERTAATESAHTQKASAEARDSVRVVTRDRVVYRTDTLTVKEVVREYGAPVLVRDTVLVTPLVRETTRETEQGARLAWQEKADTIARSFEEGTRSEVAALSSDEKHDRATDDKSGRYLTLIALGALAILLYFLDKRIDKWKLLE